MAKKAKEPVPVIDAWSVKDKARLRSKIRDAWRYSTPWRLCKKRCTTPDGYGQCEKCGEKCPTVYVDHIIPAGSIEDTEFLERMCVPSTQLQGLCKKCHLEKTKAERKASCKK